MAREYGVPVGDLIDFSASISLLGPPRSVLERLQRDAADTSSLARYPDPEYAELRSTLAEWLNVPPACIVIANGSAALLGAVVRSIRPDTCLLPAPAFSEQQQALVAAGCRIERFPLSAADGFRLDVPALCRTMALRKPSLCVLTNPHNPSGALTTAAEMLTVMHAAAAADVRPLIDEAFIDFAVSETLTELAPHDHVIVLRSLTKLFGMPALRVGYAVAAPEMAARIGAQLPAWPVTTLAAGAAVEAIRDEAYARAAPRGGCGRAAMSARAAGRPDIETCVVCQLSPVLRLPARAPDSAGAAVAVDSPVPDRRPRLPIIRRHGGRTVHPRGRQVQGRQRPPCRSRPRGPSGDVRCGLMTC